MPYSCGSALIKRIVQLPWYNDGTRYKNSPPIGGKGRTAYAADKGKQNQMQIKGLHHGKQPQNYISIYMEKPYGYNK